MWLLAAWLEKSKAVKSQKSKVNGCPKTSFQKRVPNVRFETEISLRIFEFDHVRNSLEIFGATKATFAQQVHLVGFITMSAVDRTIIEVLIYCILLEVTPSKISNNFLLKQTDGEVFHPFDIHHINRSVVKSLRSSLKSYRTKPLGGKSVSASFAIVCSAPE